MLTMYARYSILEFYATYVDTRCFQLRWRNRNLFAFMQKRMKTYTVFLHIPHTNLETNKSCNNQGM